MEKMMIAIKIFINNLVPEKMKTIYQRNFSKQIEEPNKNSIQI